MGPHRGTGGPHDTLTEAGPDPRQLTVVGGQRGAGAEQRASSYKQVFCSVIADMTL